MSDTTFSVQRDINVNGYLRNKMVITSQSLQRSTGGCAYYRPWWAVNHCNAICYSV